MNPLNQERSKTQVLVGKVFQASYLWLTLPVLDMVVLVKEKVGRGSGGHVSSNCSTTTRAALKIKDSD